MLLDCSLYSIALPIQVTTFSRSYGDRKDTDTKKEAKIFWVKTIAIAKLEKQILFREHYKKNTIW